MLKCYIQFLKKPSNEQWLFQWRMIFRSFRDDVGSWIDAIQKMSHSNQDGSFKQWLQTSLFSKMTRMTVLRSAFTMIWLLCLKCVISDVTGASSTGFSWRPQGSLLNPLQILFSCSRSDVLRTLTHRQVVVSSTWKFSVSSTAML